MPTAIIKLVLRWLAGITAEQWADAVANVIDLAKHQMEGNEKAQAFVSRIAKAYQSLPTWEINLLREAAVAYARKKGLA